jgi:hypothetical protein
MVSPTATGLPGDEDRPDDRDPQVQEALRILADLVAVKPVAMN